jgi:L-fuculose-phosphate aldolase
MNELSYPEMRNEMCVTAKNMWDKRLTNAAGGNFAVRMDENRLLITPSLMSERKHCVLEPKDILLIDFEKRILEGEGTLSRETNMHIRLLRAAENGTASLHAHPFHCMPFVAAGKAIPSVTEATMGRGDVGCVPYTPANSPELAEAVGQYFEERHELVRQGPLGVILPLHGIVVIGADIYVAYSMLECIEYDAYCTLAKSLLP